MTPNRTQMIERPGRVSAGRCGLAASCVVLAGVAFGCTGQSGVEEQFEPADTTATASEDGITDVDAEPADTATRPDDAVVSVDGTQVFDDTVEDTQAGDAGPQDVEMPREPLAGAWVYDWAGGCVGGAEWYAFDGPRFEWTVADLNACAPQLHRTLVGEAFWDGGILNLEIEGDPEIGDAATSTSAAVIERDFGRLLYLGVHHILPGPGSAWRLDEQVRGVPLRYQGGFGGPEYSVTLVSNIVPPPDLSALPDVGPGEAATVACTWSVSVDVQVGTNPPVADRLVFPCEWGEFETASGDIVRDRWQVRTTAEVPSDAWRALLEDTGIAGDHPEEALVLQRVFSPMVYLDPADSSVLYSGSGERAMREWSEAVPSSIEEAEQALWGAP